MVSKTATYMTMPCTVSIVDDKPRQKIKKIIDEIFAFYKWVDDTFSPFIPTSEISRINGGTLKLKDASVQVNKVLELCEETKQQTNGYFDIDHEGKIDPSGLVKGWAINQAAEKLKKAHFKNYFVEIAGDIQASGVSDTGKAWLIGIQNPFNLKQIVKVVVLNNNGIATSGTYINGAHIYDPVSNKPLNKIVSLSVIAKDVFEADRFATAAFAMGDEGIYFIENQPGLEGYSIDNDKQAVYTTNFHKYIKEGVEAAYA